MIEKPNTQISGYSCWRIHLAWGPAQLSSANDMNVEMVNTLCTMQTIVDHQPKSITSKTFINSNFFCSVYQMPQNIFLVLSCIAQTIHSILVFWNNKKMFWRLGIDVFECHTKVVFIDNVAWNFFGYKFVEKCRQSRIYCRIAGCCCGGSDFFK